MVLHKKETMSNRRTFIKSTSLLFAAAATMGYKATYAKKQFTSINSKENTSMLLHNVYFYLNEGVTDSEKKGFEKGTKKFLSAVPEIQKFDIGIPAGTPARDVVDHSFGYSIFVWFKNIDDHNAYQVHPAHEEFINNFSGLWKKVQVIDSELL